MTVTLTGLTIDFSKNVFFRRCGAVQAPPHKTKDSKGKCYDVAILL